MGRRQLQSPVTTGQKGRPRSRLANDGSFTSTSIENIAMGAVASVDWKRWEDISTQLQFPEGARHGTVLRVRRAVLNQLLRLNSRSGSNSKGLGPIIAGSVRARVPSKRLGV